MRFSVIDPLYGAHNESVVIVSALFYQDVGRKMRASII